MSSLGLERVGAVLSFTAGYVDVLADPNRGTRTEVSLQYAVLVGAGLGTHSHTVCITVGLG